MSLLAIGMSHRSAPVELLERAALGSDGIGKLLAELLATEHVDEALVLATCNRLEVYADVAKFHGGVQDVTSALSVRTGLSLEELTEHLYVHYEDRGVQHLYAVAAGLDSMVVGEQQILGQLRSALAAAREEHTVGRLLGPVVESALRVGKRAHSETGIDRAGRSLVSVGVGLAARSVGDLSQCHALVVGAGSMSSLAATELSRQGARSLTVVNRTLDRARRLAEQVDAEAGDLGGLPAAVRDADVIVSCTGAVGVVVEVDSLAGRGGRPTFVLDLALPHDVDPAARALPGVTVVGLDDLRGVLEASDVTEDVEAVRRIVTEEVGDYLARRRADRVAPTVVALRERAQQVVDAELARLLGKLPDADERTTRELRMTLERVVDKLLHAPTVRVKELAAAPGGDSYADALRELFSLDAAATEAVARADVAIEGIESQDSPEGIESQDSPVGAGSQDSAAAS
jgi:glutamyl-tRNA reductase